jgi:hypothetical protein
MLIKLLYPSPRRSPDHALGTSEGFTEDAHKDERWEGGLIGAEQAKLAELGTPKGK